MHSAYCKESRRRPTAIHKPTTRPIAAMPEKQRRPDDASATRANAGPERPPLWDPEEMDIEAGTTSGGGLSRKPEKGSKSRKGT